MTYDTIVKCHACRWY